MRVGPPRSDRRCNGGEVVAVSLMTRLDVLVHGVCPDVRGYLRALSLRHSKVRQGVRRLRGQVVAGHHRPRLCAP